MANAVKKTISLPADLARETEALAVAEGKTLSAVIQEALRQARIVRREQEFRTLQGYWSRKARDKGLLTEEDLERYLAEPGALARLQPPIADALLTSRPIREPARTFSLFTWLNNGGVVMEWLISGIEEQDAGAPRVPTGIVSIAALADWLKLSRTHLARKLREAEEMGSIGWEGKRGRSVMWVSDGFRREYARAQAVKLAIIDDAFDVRFRPSAAQMTTADSPRNSQHTGGPSN